MKICFHCTILSLCLAIYLRMEGGEKLSLNIKEVIEQKPELENKNCSVVTNDRVEEVIILHHHINNYFPKTGSINIDFNRFIIHFYD